MKYLIIMIISALVFSAVIQLRPQAHVEFVVEDKDRIVDRDGNSSRYLVWAEEGEVFENVDSLLYGKFDSSNLYGKLKVGNKYRCHVSGWRIEFLSWYRNLISCDEVSV